MNLIALKTKLEVNSDATITPGSEILVEEPTSDVKSM